MTPESSLTADQIALVKENWQRVSISSGILARRFYSRLFELDPKLESTLFRDTDMEQQGKKLADTLSFAVRGLDHLELLVPAIGQLGERHEGYGVSERHYDFVKQALLDALRSCSERGGEFDEATEAAWVATYDTLAAIMKDGSQGASTAVPGI